MLGGEQMHGVRIRADGKMLLHSQRNGVTHVGYPILTFLAVMDEQLACVHVNVIHPTEELSGRALDSLRRPIALFQAQETVQRHAQPFRYFVQALWHG